MSVSESGAGDGVLEKKPPYYAVADLCSGFLRKYGATDPRGVGWFNQAIVEGRLNAMLGVTFPLCVYKEVTLLDVGAGTGHLPAYIARQPFSRNIRYHGIDLSPEMVAAAREKQPRHSFEIRDILVNPFPPHSFDFVVMSGVLTSKMTMTTEEMKAYAINIITACFDIARYGIAFNCMSQFVDYKDDVCFYWDIVDAVKTLREHCSRRIMVNMAYEGYEASYYVYKDTPAVLSLEWQNKC